MKRVGIAVLVLVGVGGLIALLGYHPKKTTVVAVKPKATASSSPSPSANGAQTQAPSAAAAYKDGTYTGTAITNAYGPVQVSAVVSGGKITKINFLQMPSDQQHSQEVTAAAEPVLQQEAIAAQSATVDTVSSATQDTEAFSQSLQSALTQAKA